MIRLLYSIQTCKPCLLRIAVQLCYSTYSYWQKLAIFAVLKLAIIKFKNIYGSGWYPWLGSKGECRYSSKVNTKYAKPCSKASLPQSWKCTNIVPIPKEKPVRDINRHPRPFSLTPII